MAINVALTHKSHYRYDRRVSLGPQVVRLRPAPHCRTPILSYSLKVHPTNHFMNWQQDPQSNYLARLVFPEPTTEFSLEVDLVAEMGVFNPFDFFLEPYAEQSPFSYDAPLARELRPYLETQPAGTRISEFLARVPRLKMRTIDFLVDLNKRVKDEVGYVIRMEPGVQTCEQTLDLRTGSCRDSAWLLVEIMRHLGFATRFVSGYLIQLQEDIKPLEGPGGPLADFTDLHAWAEVYLPGAGWIGFDPTSGMLAGEGHIPLACTPDASGAAPISGSIDPCNTQFEHQMTVRRIYESPRVTKPYVDGQWQEIETLGHQVDAKLRAGDVRLTMGGEPTFISLDDADGDEWTRDAMGPAKRKLAVALLGKLRDRFAPQALLHYGQGKWYPGEMLPRWALSCYWRKDGVAIWENPRLIAEDAKDYGYTSDDARRFLDALTRRLQVDASVAMSAYEDTFYYLWKERRLPVNVDPLDPKLEDPIERKRVVRIFEEGLGKLIGYVLPLRRITTNHGTHRWTSQAWFLRSENIFLIPGDSPIGYRLPLESLPWTKPEDVLYSLEPDRPRGAHAPRRTHGERALRRAARYRRPASTSGTRQTAGRGGVCAVGGASRALRTAARRQAVRLHAAGRVCCRLLGSGGSHRRNRCSSEHAGHAGRLPTTVRSENPGAAGDPRSGRYRSKHPPGGFLGRAGAHHRGGLLDCARNPAGRREIHAGRATHRHRRGQPHRNRRPYSGGQRLFASPRSFAEHGRLLAQPSCVVVSVLRYVYRTYQPASACR